MSEHEQADRQLLTRMRAADPAASLATAEPDEVVRLLGDAMSEETRTESRETGIRHRSPLTWLVAAAAVVVIAAVAVFTLTQRGATPAQPAPMPTVQDEPTVVTVSLPGGAATQRCMTPTAETLSTADLAFDGEVVDVGRTVTLVPTRIYSGGPAENVRVTQATQSRQALILGVRFEEGGRYLVAANGGDVMVCGFSGTYDAELADLYAEAFAR